MQLGVTGYVQAVEDGVKRALYTSKKILKRAKSQLGKDQPEVLAALESVQDAVGEARSAVRDKQPLADITYGFQQRVDEAARSVVASDLSAMRADLDASRRAST